MSQFVRLRGVRILSPLICCAALFLCLGGCGGGSSGGSNSGSNGSGSGGGSNPGSSGNPVPALTSLSPTGAEAGGASFTLTANGSNFVSTSTVQWNGNALQTTFVSSTELQANVPVSDIAGAASVSITVITPAPGGGTSSALTFPVTSPGLTESITLNQPANDIVWDSVHQVIYASVPSSAGAATGNTITAINPVTGAIASSQFAGSEPDVLAISGDCQFLYVGLDGSASVQRFVLPGLSTDINYSLGQDSFFGPYFALDLQTAPGAPHTTAVTLGNFNVSPAAEGGVQIFDDATMRPTTLPGFGAGGLFDSLQWGSDATELYAANNEDTGFDFYTMTVSPTGVVLDKDYGGAFSIFGIRIHYDSGTQLVYSDDGHVINPANGLPAGEFEASGVMTPDSSLNTAFFIGQTQDQFGSTNFTIESFDLTHFVPLNSTIVSNISGAPVRLIRWGTNGLAFNTDQGQIVLLGGSFVAPSDALPINARVLTNHVQRTWTTPRVHVLPRAAAKP